MSLFCAEEKVKQTNSVAQTDLQPAREGSQGRFFFFRGGVEAFAPDKISKSDTPGWCVCMCGCGCVCVAVTAHQFSILKEVKVASTLLQVSLLSFFLCASLSVTQFIKSSLVLRVEASFLIISSEIFPVFNRALSQYISRLSPPSWH